MAKPLESWIQDLVYNVDVGIGVRLAKMAVYALFVLGLAVLYQISEFRGLKDPEAMDFAQLGRNLATDGKLVTQYIRPASLWYLRTHGPGQSPRIMSHPDLVHPPAYPALLALAFKIAGTNFDMAGPPGVFPPEGALVLPVNHLFSLLTGWMVFLLARHLFDRRVAVLSATAYFLSSTVWASSVTGAGHSVAAFFATTALYFALRAVWPGDEKTGDPARIAPGFFLLALFFAALGFLTRYGVVVVIPVIACYLAVAVRPRGWVWGTAFLLAFLLAVSPWLVRNQRVSGGLLGLAPCTALNDTSLFDEDSFERSFNPEFTAGKAFAALQEKCLRNLSTYYQQQLRALGDGFFICFFLTALFFRFTRTDVHAFRWCTVLGMVLLLLLAGYFGNATVRLFIIFLPVVIVYGAAFFFLLLDRLQFRLRILNYAVLGAFLLLTAAPLLVTLLPPRATVPYPPYFPPYISHVSRLLAPDELMCTDMPWATAWYGRRNSLHLPVTLDQFYEINDYHKRISGLYFTPVTRNKPYIGTLATGPYRTWFPILQGQTPADFPLMQGFPINNLDQLFLTDRVRWAR